MSTPHNPAVDQSDVKIITQAYKPLSHQIAGHTAETHTYGMLECNDGTLLKPIQGPPRGEREQRFYEYVFSDTMPNISHTLTSLRSFLPRFYGIVSTPQVVYMRLEDITTKFSVPCIIDVKIGPRTWDPEASHTKAKHELGKCPAAQLTGYRILGLRVPYADSVLRIRKEFFWTCSAEDMVQKGIRSFFSDEDGTVRRIPVIQTLSTLRHIIDWFECQRLYHFYASSLLIVYEGDLTKLEEHKYKEQTPVVQNGIHVSPENAKKVVDVRMIDFAHVFQSDGTKDQNYLFGITKLYSHLESLLK